MIYDDKNVVGKVTTDYHTETTTLPTVEKAYDDTGPYTTQLTVGARSYTQTQDKTSYAHPTTITTHETYG